jgi:ATP-dependent Clp protease ATP-binding subunit ClpC
LDEGFLTDSLGRKVDFRNTIILMTSNIGSRQLKDFGQGVGFSTSNKTNAAATDTNSKSVIETALKRFFSPEFLNRIDDVIIFNPLKKEDIILILDIAVAKLEKRIESVGFKIKLTDSAKEFLAEKGFDAEFGARPLNRAIQKYLEDPIAEEILKHELTEGEVIEVSYEKDAEELKFSGPTPKKESKRKKDTPAEENDK